MTDTKHTLGPLLVRADGSHDGSLLDPCRLFHPYLQSRPEGGGVHVARSVRREDADRLASCYNALEGLTDAEIESLPDAETIRAYLIKRVRKCGGCNGTGQVFHESFDEWWGCPRCKGTGKAT